MIKLDGNEVTLNHFPDGALLIKSSQTQKFGYSNPKATISWQFENNEELVALIYLVGHLRSHGVKHLFLEMPYIPNARQDRVKTNEDVFTLKYFSDVINSLAFEAVYTLDPHSYVSEALINNIVVDMPVSKINHVVEDIKLRQFNDIIFFYPDEGAMKRYSGLFSNPYVFGIKKRNWETGIIEGLDVSGRTELLRGNAILIIDDISSRGGTFYYSAKKLKELGADEIYLYVSHCENTILEGEVLSSGLIEKIYTTNSIFTASHEKIEVMNYAKN